MTDLGIWPAAVLGYDYTMQGRTYTMVFGYTKWSLLLILQGQAVHTALDWNNPWRLSRSDRAIGGR
jgi:hypothetical protein